MSSTTGKRISLVPGTGRACTGGLMCAPFKADCGETSYPVSELWLEANTRGPGAYSHHEDDIFYVLGGVMSFLIGEEWIDAPKASFVLVPSGILHDLENRGVVRAGVLNFSSQENFEKYMPDVVEWYKENPAEKGNN